MRRGNRQKLIIGDEYEWCPLESRAARNCLCAVFVRLILARRFSAAGEVRQLQ